MLDMPSIIQSVHYAINNCTSGPPFLAENSVSLSNLHLFRIDCLVFLAGLGSEYLLRQDSDHGQQSPRRVGRLGANTDPVFGALCIELDILVELS